MKPFADKLAARFQGSVITPIDRELGFNLKDLIGLARGQITLAFLMEPASQGSNSIPGLVWILDAKDQSPALARLLNQSSQQRLVNGRRVTRHTLAGSEFVTLTITNKLWTTPQTNSPSKSAELQATNSPSGIEVTIGQVDTAFYAATSSNALESVLTRRAGVPSAPPGLHAWDSSLDALTTREAHFFVCLNVKMLSELLFSKPAVPGPREDSPLSMKKVFSALGFGELKSLSLSYQRINEGEQLQFALSIRELERKGLIKMLAFENQDALPPAFVPVDISKFLRLRINLPRSWAALENTLASAFPSATGALKLMFDYAGKDKDSSFDVRRELIGQLGNDFISYKRMAPSNAPDSSVYLISSPAPEKLARAIRIVLSSLGPPGTRIQQSPGSTAYSVILPGIGPATSNGPHQTAWYVGVRTGYVAAARSPGALNQCLQEQIIEKPLRQTDRLLSGFKNLGLENPPLLGFINPEEEIRASYDNLKAGTNLLSTLVKMLSARAGPENDLANWVDFRLLPSFNSLSNHISPAFFGGGADSEKLYWKLFTTTATTGKTNRTR